MKPRSAQLFRIFFPPRSAQLFPSNEAEIRTTISPLPAEIRRSLSSNEAEIRTTISPFSAEIRKSRSGFERCYAGTIRFRLALAFPFAALGRRTSVLDLFVYDNI